MRVPIYKTDLNPYMGCLPISRFLHSFSTPTPQECVEQLKDIESILHKLMERYQREALESREEARRLARQQYKYGAKARLKRARMLDHQLAGVAMRLAACESKRLAIEQLSTIEMQVGAVKESSKTFKKFLKEHDLEKIEQLQESLSEMITEVCDISSTLEEEVQPLMVSDEDLDKELESLMLIQEVHDMPIAPADRLVITEEPHTSERKKINSRAIF